MAGYSTADVVQRLEDAVIEHRDVLRENPGLMATVKLSKAHLRQTNPDPDGTKVASHQQEREFQKVLTRERAVMQARAELAAEEARKTRGALTLVTPEDLMEMPTVEWHVEGFIPKDGLVFVFGDSNVGKTVVVMDLIASCAAGVKFVNHFDTRPTRFLYLTGEGQSGIGARLVEAGQQHDIKLTSEHVLAGIDGVALMDPESVAGVCEWVVEHDIDVVILDTYAQLAGVMDENDAATNSRALQAANRIQKARPGTSVVLIHHSGKDADRGMRGSSALRGNVDYVWQLDTDSNSEVEGGVGLALSSFPSNGGKARHSAPETVRGFARVDGHIEIAETAPSWLMHLPLGKPVTTAEVHKAINLSDSTNKRQTRKAVEDKYLIKREHGIYERSYWKQ